MTPSTTKGTTRGVRLIPQTRPIAARGTRNQTSVGTTFFQPWSGTQAMSAE